MQDDEKYDIISYIQFVRKHWVIHCATLAFTVGLTVIYCFFFMERVYESKAVLYYPAAKSEKIENASTRELMDDAAAIMGQEIMLVKVEQDVEIPWEEVQRSTVISANQENGIINITVRMSSGEKAYKCAEALVKVFCTDLPKLVPIGELVLVSRPQEAKEPVADGIKMELVVGVLAGIVLGSLLSWGKERKIIKGR